MIRKSKTFVLGALALAVAAAPALAQDATGAKKDDGGLVGLLIGLVLAVVALFVSLGLAMKAVQVAIGMFDKLTQGLDEWEELKKGNVAVGLLMAAVIYAISNVISSGVSALTTSLMHPELKLHYLLAIVVGVINLAIALWIGTYVVGLTVKILDKMTKNIEEMKEIAKGNVAVSVLVAGVLLAVSQIVAQGVMGISRIVSVESIAHALGISL